jgi:hypothetical protein
MIGRSISKALLASSIVMGMLVFAMPARAGSTGNGIAPVVEAHYSYCFGGLPKTIYFSSVVTSAPAANAPDLNGPFGAYLTKTYGVGSNDGGQCMTSAAMADTVRGKKQREAEFVAKAWKIVETKWAGAGAQ